MSVITDCPYICAPNIMDTPDYTTKMVTLDMGNETVIKAGTPISADGKVANDETAIGILLNDCHACPRTSRGLVVISGRIKQDVAADHSGVTISNEAKSAMVNITFTGDGARGGGRAQPDWNQNDENAPDYIQNRPGGYTAFLTTENNYSIAFYVNQGQVSPCEELLSLLPGQKVTAEIDGIVYEDMLVKERNNKPYFGDPYLVEYPFVVNYSEYAGGVPWQYCYCTAAFGEGTKTVKITTQANTLVKIPASLVDMQTDPAENPVFTGSFSQNRLENSNVGDYSHAEGNDTTASGSCSHAEGGNTTASGQFSHAGGYRSTASGVSSHAEGHACDASGNYSHAEGLGTVAQRESQHVQGEYNILDTQGTATTRGMYAHIVGNGRGAANRSNAHTLSWDGVPWFQGRPRFGGTAQDNGSQTVVGNGDKEIILKSSTADSTKRFKITVDDSGTLSATEVTE